MSGGIDHDYRVKIPYTYIYSHGKKNELWNEVCARAIELFGLPGDRYSCKFADKNIEFCFLEQKDAMIFELCCG